MMKTGVGNHSGIRPARGNGGHVRVSALPAGYRGFHAAAPRAAAMTAAYWLFGLLTAGVFAYLRIEKRLAARARARLKHVVHVNGTRGKSSVTRLIGAGLRAGGLRVMSKTTGTVPQLTGVDGREEFITRHGNPNIREQLLILRRAAAQHADVLVIECMAITPELQRVTQHEMLGADIAVITNARRDHADLMGDTKDDVLSALLTTVPENGAVFTASGEIFSRLRAAAQAAGSEAVLAEPVETTLAHPDNVAVAAAVCQRLGVDRETAIRGMEAMIPDRYAGCVRGMGKAVVVDALSANDVDSTLQAYTAARETRGWTLPLALLLCLRQDRPTRTAEMLRLAAILRPERIYLLGAAPGWLPIKLRKALPEAAVIRMKHERDIDTDRETLLLAAGNIKGPGIKFADWIREDGHAV